MAQTTASIPVDLRSPGQVLACMGFIEAAEVLLGGVEAHFDWSGPQATFVLRADGDKNPFEVVLNFLANAKVIDLTPKRYVQGGAGDTDGGEEDEMSSEESEGADEDGAGELQGREEAPCFPMGEGVRNALPLRLAVDADQASTARMPISHWADGSSRSDFKLYSGNRSAKRIAIQMLQGVRAEPKKNQTIGDLKNRGLQQLWQERRQALMEAPFEVVTPMGGSFNFDPRGGWTAIDAGYSPNTQKDSIAASPVVEILAAIGLEHARPYQYDMRQDDKRRIGYVVWGHPLPPMLARAALSGCDLKVPVRRFEFRLGVAGKNKITTFAQEDAQP